MKAKERKLYFRPMMAIERFVTNEYTSACFTYEANLVCAYGAVYPSTSGGPDGHGCWEVTGHNPWNNADITGAQHGEPCANSIIKVSVVNGVATYEGHEGGNKTDIHLENVNIPDIEQPHQPGDHLENCSWTSTLGGTYHHKGSGTVIRWIYDESTSSNHS